jgi:hypothetical protein
LQPFNYGVVFGHGQDANAGYADSALNRRKALLNDLGQARCVAIGAFQPIVAA